MPADALDRKSTADHATAGTLAAAVLAAPAVESWHDQALFRICALEAELAFGFGLRAARAREAER